MIFENFFWESLFIRKGKEEDINFISNAEHDQENISFVTQWSPDQHHNFMQYPSSLYLIPETKDGQKVGFVILDQLNSPHKNVEIKRIIITQKGQGYGRIVLRAIKDLVFNKFKNHRLWLDVLDFNIRAKNLYESEGFKVEGIWRECWLANEKFYSLIFLSILENEYKASIGIPEKNPKDPS